jgi:hypothetical protein
MMHKIIILEGPDGGGKSTLAAWLHKIHGYDIVKTGPPSPTGDVTATYLCALHDAAQRSGLTVFDRLHLGEAIYGPLLRGVDRMGAPGLTVIECAIKHYGVKLVICSPPWETLVAGWSSKDDLLRSMDQLHTVRNEYLKHVERLGLQVYDWTADDAENVLKGMIEI